MTKPVITIARQFGSAGAEIGKKLAERLEINYYDKDLVKEAAKKSGISEELFQRADEKPTNSFLYSLTMAHYSGYAAPLQMNDILTDDKLFHLQAETIKHLAEEPCVIIGRCADDILRDHPNCVRIFIHADMPVKVQRIKRIYDLTEKSAETLIRKTDKKRSSYYHFYTNKVWGAAEHFDFTINSGVYGVDAAIDAIIKMIDIKFSSATGKI